MAKRTTAPKRGDRVEVVWLDICEDSIGNPDDATCLHRVSIAYFWDRRTVDYAGLKADLVVTCTTLDSDNHTQQGWTSYPAGTVLGIRVLRGKT